MKKSTLLCWSLQAMLLVAGATALSAQQENEVVVKKIFKDGNNNKCETYSYNWKDHYDEERDPCKVFIGVETNNNVDGGLEVTRVIDNTPATTYGVKEGDIIRSIDGVNVTTQSQLITQRDKHQQGESFTLAIVRDGREMTINARFNSCTADEQEQSKKRLAEQGAQRARELQMFRGPFSELNNAFNTVEMVERPILGIYPGESVDRGVVVSSVISGKGAEAAGLQEGDVIVNVDGKAMRGEGGIAEALTGHKGGDKVSVVYLRNGQTAQTEVTLSSDRSYTVKSIERDPCKVFIGVYTNNVEQGGKGVRVTGVIDDTPAKVSNIVVGDIILQLDGAPVNSYTELHQQRDKHQPGDRFQLTILRDGKTMVIDAQFKSCDKTNKINEKPPVQPKTETEQRGTGSSLKINTFNLSPNPTVGQLNIEFEGDAVPTTVTITDLSGKTVYSNVMNQFAGYFNEQINLDDQAPGNYVASIRQGEKVVTKKFILLPKA